MSINWPSIVTAFGTVATAIVIGLSAYFGIKTYRNSIKKEESELLSKLYTDFKSSHFDIFNKLSNQIYPEGSINIFKKDSRFDSLPLILFFAKLGKLLKDKKISIKELEYYFYEYLYFKDKIDVLVNNLKSLHKELPDDIFDNFKFLMYSIGEEKNIEEFKTIIGKNFRKIAKFYDSGKAYNGLDVRKSN